MASDNESDTPIVLTSEQKGRLSTLRRKRGTISAQLTTYEKSLNSYKLGEKHDRAYLEIAAEAIKNAWSNFEDIQFDIEGLQPDEQDKRFEMQARYFFLLAETKKALENNQTTSAQPTNVLNMPSGSTNPYQIIEQQINVKLPQITLPTFEGAYEDWAAFFDLFQSLIHNNSSLSSVQKLQYLRSAIQGKAAKIIESLETTEKNYDDAIKLLKNKYDCSNRIMRRHWTLLKEIPRAHKDSPDSITNLIDSFRQHLCALENLGQPVNHWELPLIDLLISKINPETAFQWDLTTDNDEGLSYTHLMNFLEKRASCFESIAATAFDKSFEKYGNKKTNKVQAYYTNPQDRQAYIPQCAICKEAHKIYSCERFRAMSPDERREEVSKASLCFNCLSKGHNRDQCSSKSRCHTCQQAHHSLLHLDNASTSN